MLSARTAAIVQWLFVEDNILWIDQMIKVKIRYVINILNFPMPKSAITPVGTTQIKSLELWRTDACYNKSILKEISMNRGDFFRRKYFLEFGRFFNHVVRDKWIRDALFIERKHQMKNEMSTVKMVRGLRGD